MLEPVEMQQEHQPLELLLPDQLDSARTPIQLHPQPSQPSRHPLPTLDKHNMDKARDSTDKARDSTDKARASTDKAKDNMGRANMGKAKASMDKTRDSMGKGSMGKIIRAW